MDNSPHIHGQVKVLKWLGVANPDAVPFQAGPQIVHSHLPLLFCDETFIRALGQILAESPHKLASIDFDEPFQFTLSYTNSCTGVGKDQLTYLLSIQQWHSYVQFNLLMNKMRFWWPLIPTCALASKVSCEPS